MEGKDKWRGIAKPEKSCPSCYLCEPAKILSDVLKNTLDILKYKKHIEVRQVELNFCEEQRRKNML